MFVPLALVLLVTGLFWLCSASRSEEPGGPLPAKVRFAAFGQAGVLALAAGGFYWRTMQLEAEPYGDFIGGFLGVSGMPKSFEYTAEYVGLAVFGAAAFLLCRWYRRLAAEPGYAAIVARLGFYSLLPGFVMAGQAVTVSSLEPLTTLPALAVLLLLPALAVIPTGDAAAASRTAERCYGGLLLFPFSLAGIQFFQQRVWEGGSSLAGILYAAVLVLMLWLVRKDSAPRNCDRFFFIAQLGIPLLFLYLLPPPLQRRDGSWFDPGFHWTLSLLAWVLAGIAWCALVRAFRRAAGGNFRVPLPVLLAVAATLLAGGEGWPAIWQDDYHNGEVALPWYLWQTMGCVPYLDYIPSRGLINYLPGFFTWLFRGHDISLLGTGQKLANLVVLALLLAPLRRRCGTVAAFLAVLAISDLGCGIGAGLTVAIAFFFFLTEPERYRNPVRWLWWFGVLGVIGIFYSLTDTAAMVLAMSPLLVRQLWRAVTEQRQAFCLSAGAVAVAALLLLLTPFYRIIGGMLCILLEQTGVYTLAHCVPWMGSRELDVAVTQGLFWQFVRFGWLGVGAMALFFLFRKRRGTVRDELRFLGSSSILILAVLLIQRAGGRIDLGSTSRIFTVSGLYVGILVPWLLPGLVRRRTLLGCWAVALGLYGLQCADWRNLWNNCTETVVEPENVVNLEAAGFPMLGRAASIQPDHLAHLVGTKALLDRVLKPEESYLDMTNNATGYAYFRRRPPVSYPAWNYVASRPQVERMVREVKAAKPLLVLVKGRDVNFYEGRLPFRAHALYRYLLAEYLPFRDTGGRIWMIRRGAEARLKGVPQVDAASIGDMALASEAFQDPKIDAYPFAWGASLERLAPHLSDPVPARAAAGKHLQNGGGGLFFAQPGGAELQLELPAGASGDFLLLEFDRPIIGRDFRVLWEDVLAGKGRPWVECWGGSHCYLIPLDNSPNWLLSPWKRNIRVKLPGAFAGEFRLLRAEFLRRR